MYYYFKGVFSIFPYLVSIQILSAVSKTKPKILRKMYEQILSDDCVPLTEIPVYQQEAYIKDYLLRDHYVDIDLMQCVSRSAASTTSDDTEYLPDPPYLSVGVQSFFKRTSLIREALRIQNAFAADRTVTARLTDLAASNQTTYRTLMRERRRFMKHTSLMNLLSDPNKGEDTTDRYRNCCFYCRDYIIAQHESAGRPTDNSILRETQKLASFPCTKCPYLNKEFCESGMLEWLGITQVKARVYNGRAKPIERIWRIIEDEFICKMQGYCGNKPSTRPATLADDMRSGNLYTFEQFADIFAEVIYPGYNNFKADGSESPTELYLRLPKAKTIVPSWRTLSVLKRKKKSCAVYPNGIHYGTHNGKPLIYWHPGLARFIRPQMPYEKVQVYAFDEPFNRSLAIVYGQVFIGEAHLVEGLNLIEEKRYRVIQHLQEQNAQLKTYSSHIRQMHNIVLQNNLVELGTGIPAIDNVAYSVTDNVAYGQIVDEENTAADDDIRIPEELKDLAASYQELTVEKEAPDLIGSILAEIGSGHNN